MSKAKKTLIVISVTCLLIGSVISFCALAKTGFDIDAFTITIPEKVNPPANGENDSNTADNNTNNTTTYVNGADYSTEREIKPDSVNNSFNNINISSDDYDVRFELSDNGQPLVKIREFISNGNNEPNNIEMKVEVIGDELSVVRRYKGSRTDYWWNRMAYGGVMTVVLPKAEYDRLTVSCVNGDISISDEFSFEDADVTTVNGDIIINCDVKQRLSAINTNGDISASNITAQKSIALKSVDGDIIMHDMSVGDIEAKSTNGDVSMTDVISNGRVEAKTLSGSITLNRCDADELTLTSTSGDIYGSILTEKQFTASTVSGDAHVPNCQLGKNCKASTVSGDIIMRVED